MRRISIQNPFGAPVYHEETVSSTMDVSRILAKNGEPHGTVIITDFQEEGRGRIRDRSWKTEREKNLLFTVLLRYPRIEEIPAALTLRAGLAVSLAVENLAPALSGRILIKWPNDVLIVPQSGGAAQKFVGILTEANGGNVHIGIGINVAQKIFPSGLEDKATSISLALNRDIEMGEKNTLLEKVLVRLYDEIENNNGVNWRERLEQRLYGKGERVCFAPGAAGSEKEVTGTLAGMGPGGELLIVPDGENAPRHFITGEIRKSTFTPL